jgi:hypothetical protein
MRRVCETIVAVENHEVLHVSVCVRVRARESWRVGVCMCMRAYNVTYPACNAHAPYCHLCSFCSTTFFGIIS